ncbi:GNAT family N-acetyltransferase [Nonomuraea muscovyensis]|uniref:Ribosomal protein S18 acetylase RimI-like enzyme n=1 Tax=Nonomuraea muscovyensis TaxID=1124761 RepID=A0A7X0CD84_9ACTN|nr:GNAT family N-acetyltransferase [Nonomuraea muscovyensis]MBB6351656.1 ribosomal protein S18 acetylase RimI-like enzyme [Nonomuraea muscovyensis]
MHITGISPHDDPLGGRLLGLQHAAYAVEAELIGDDRIPPLRESLEDLRGEPLTWVGAFDDGGRLVGAVAWTESADEVDLDRLVVDPAAHRRGIGRALVEEVLARAGGRRIVVSTGRDNKPARALYERLGFRGRGEHEVIPGLWIASYLYERPAPGRPRGDDAG